jgi:hypothetical protein
MTLRFYRRLSIIPGPRVNLSRSGPSFSIGHRGAWYTKGRRATVGLPGTALFWTDHNSPASLVHTVHRVSLVALATIGIAVMLILASR